MVRPAGLTPAPRAPRGSLTRLSRVRDRTVCCLIAGLSQIAGPIVNPGLQRTKYVGDVLGLHSRRVGAADAGMHHVDIAAAPHRSRLSNGDAIAWSIREFDGSQPLPLMPLILHIIDLQIMPIGAPPGDLVQVVKVFLIVARITTNVAPPWQRTGRVHLVGSKPSISASIANFPTVSMTTSSPMSQGLLLPN